MNWFFKFLTSSIGQKLVMSLTGLFLISFLVVHLAGNIQLMTDNTGVAFNTYAKFMTGNPVIKTISYGLYAMILLHAIQGLSLWMKNRKARGGQKYAVKVTRGAEGVASSAAKQMAILGTLILAFLLIHMGDFWWAMKTEAVPMADCGGEPCQDLYTKVYASFKQLWVVIAYLVGMIALAFHLRHGFWSAFQTLGWNHPKWTPAINGLSWIIAIALPVAFAAIPLYMYFVLPDVASFPEMGGIIGN